MGMKTVVHTNIDGIEVVTGFGDAQIDPVATWSKIGDKVANLPEAFQLESLNGKIAAQRQAAADAFSLARDALKNAQSAASLGDSALEATQRTRAESYTAQYQAAVAQIAVLEDEGKPIAAAFEAAKVKIFEENASYFTPSPGESILRDADYTSLKSAFDSLGKNARLSITGQVVPDFRELPYWEKDAAGWTRGEVVRLGEKLPAGAILETALAEEQRLEIRVEAEASRIAAMTTEEKAAERDSVLKGALREATQLKSESEITGEAFDAKAWYAEKKEEIENRYA